MDFNTRGFRVGVFLDNVNIYLQCKERFGGPANHAALLDKAVGSMNYLMRAIAYGVRMGDGMDRWKCALQKLGFEIKEKEPVHGKADWDTEIIVDALRMADKLDMVVIMSGDADFIPLVQRCRELGILVRVMGVEGLTSNALIESCDEFIPITREDTLENKEVADVSAGNDDEGSTGVGQEDDG